MAPRLLVIRCQAWPKSSYSVLGDAPFDHRDPDVLSTCVAEPGIGLLQNRLVPVGPVLLAATTQPRGSMIEKSTENQPQQQASAEARPKSRIQDAVIRLAGNSQDGIQVIGGFLARLAGRTDIDVMTYMTIPATISGGASIYQVRLGTGEILSTVTMLMFSLRFTNTRTTTTSALSGKAASSSTIWIKFNRTLPMRGIAPSVCRSPA